MESANFTLNDVQTMNINELKLRADEVNCLIEKTREELEVSLKHGKNTDDLRENLINLMANSKDIKLELSTIEQVGKYAKQEMTKREDVVNYLLSRLTARSEEMESKLLRFARKTMWLHRLHDNHEEMDHYKEKIIILNKILEPINRELRRKDLRKCSSSELKLRSDGVMMLLGKCKEELDYFYTV